MEIISQPINDLFYELVSSSKKSIKLCAPYVKYSTINDLYRIKNSQCKVDLITKFNFFNFYKNSSDISAIRLIKENSGRIFNFSILHAKFYIFDDKMTIISSANLTPSGFYRNYEYGILLTESESVNKTCNDYKRITTELCDNSISEKSILELENILERVPKEKTSVPFNLEHDSFADNIVDNSLVNVNHLLSGWKKLIFEYLDKLECYRFSKDDYLKFIPDLANKYPYNNNIEAKIRQVLQQLRDLGLIKFEGGGMYMKLWK